MVEILESSDQQFKTIMIDMMKWKSEQQARRHGESKQKDRILRKNQKEIKRTVAENVECLQWTQ